MCHPKGRNNGGWLEALKIIAYQCCSDVKIHMTCCGISAPCAKMYDKRHCF